jgi:large subunit ribosomal protein LP2
MRHLAAYMLLKAGGNDAPTAGDVEKALATVGVETDSATLNAFIAEVDGKDLAELIESAKDRVFVGGGGGGGGAAAAAGGEAAAPVKEEKPKEEEVDALDGGMDMFGGGGGGGDY